LKNNKEGFLKMFKFQTDDDKGNVSKVKITLYKPVGEGTEDVEVTYEEADQVNTKYGWNYSGYRDGW
jgi:hypothetical protein